MNAILDSNISTLYVLYSGQKLCIIYLHLLLLLDGGDKWESAFLVLDIWACTLV